MFHKVPALGVIPLIMFPYSLKMVRFSAGDAGLPEPNVSTVPTPADVQERNRLLQANPVLHTELTQYLAMVTHHGCEQLELDSMSDNESSGPSSLSTCSSDSDVSQVG